MAFAITHIFQGGTKEQCRAFEKVHPGDRLPEAQIFHVAGTTPRNVRGRILSDAFYPKR